MVSVLGRSRLLGVVGLAVAALAALALSVAQRMPVTPLDTPTWGSPAQEREVERQSAPVVPATEDSAARDAPVGQDSPVGTRPGAEGAPSNVEPSTPASARDTKDMPATARPLGDGPDYPPVRVLPNGKGVRDY
jgi:hypothetical protein